MQKVHEHPNIITCIEVLMDEDFIYIVMPFCKGGNLLDLINKKGAFSEDDAREIFLQVLEALNFAHNNLIIHRDVRLESIYLSDRSTNGKPHCFLANWRFAAPYDPNSTMDEIAGYYPYCSPEICLGLSYIGPEVDVWSLGCVLYALVLGEPPFHHDPRDPDRTKAYITSAAYTIPRRSTREFQDLLAKILVIDPKKRITLKDIKNHPWVKNQTLLTSFKQSSIDRMKNLLMRINFLNQISSIILYSNY